MRHFILVIAILLHAVTAGTATAGTSILSKLTSPVLFQGDQVKAYRDPTVVYHDGVFHLYCTLSNLDTDKGLINYTAHSQSTNLKDWTPAAPTAFTPKDRNLNCSSPGNVFKYGNEWIMCLQTYPTPGAGQVGGTNDSRIWKIRNDDNLANPTDWSLSTPELLRVMGPSVSQADMGRMIDPFIVEDKEVPGKWWCFFKHKLSNGSTVVDRSFSYDLEKWNNVGKYNTATGENVCVIRDKNEYIMFTSPSNGINVYRSSSLATDNWVLQGNVKLGQSKWDWAGGRLTAGHVLDLRDDPNVGKYVMFFHGSRKDSKPETHGAASLGIAWSDDLVHWEWPPTENVPNTANPMPAANRSGWKPCAASSRTGFQPAI